MSAKGHLPKKTYPQLPSLPIELWIQICHFAIVSQDDEADLKRLRFDVALSELDTALRRSLVSGCKIVRVSKQWAEIATPLLYETVLIRKKRALLALVRTLEESKNSRGNIGLGRHVKRLVALGDHFELDPAEFTRAIRCMPNLAVAHFSGSRFLEFPEVILGALRQTCAHSLLFLNLHRSMRIPGRIWRACLLEMPNLRRVQCTVTADDNLEPLPPMNNLETYSLFSFDREYNFEAGRTRFPALREVLIPPFINRNYEPFFSYHGVNLTMISLEILLVKAGQQSSQSFQSILGSITQHCPNLIRLNLLFKQWATLFGACSRGYLNLPPVKDIGLRCHLQLQAPSPVYRELVETLRAIHFPKTLRTLQFLESRGLRDFRFHHPKIFARLIEHFHNTTVVICDDHGNPVGR